MLRRYLTTSSDNSFPAGTFQRAFVFDRASPSAADPRASSRDEGQPIQASDKQKIASALVDLMPIDFVATHGEVLTPAQESPTCMVVRDKGILITLALPKETRDEVTVQMSGYVACLGATWLTYIVKHDASGWKVTGAPGPRAIA